MQSRTSANGTNLAGVLAFVALVLEFFKMHTITTTDLDNAKSVFQVHGVDAAGKFSEMVPSHA